jgi:TonB family protein
MSAPSELWKNWEGRVIDGKFPLRQWLGSSNHSAVFLTERPGQESQRAAIKLIPAENLDESAQLSSWADAAKLSHPHLIRLFEFGRCQINDTRLLYVVMEYAEDNLSEILPVRPLSADEASEMLRPAAEALTYLHQSGFVQGHIRPSNILAVHDQLKISADPLGKDGQRSDPRIRSAYDAPETADTGASPAADIWSLGATLVAVLTQSEPKLANATHETVVVPETIPQPLREIARQCLRIDPQQRGTASDILRRLQPQATKTEAPLAAAASRPQRTRSKPWIVAGIVVAAIFLVVWVGSKFVSHQPPIPAAEVAPAKPAVDVRPEQSPAPFSNKVNPASRGSAHGSVLQQVMPDVSRGAQNTIEGRLKVSVRVSVDASGNVSQASFVTHGPSEYFANRSLAAARRWKFSPPQVNGRAVPSEWLLRFQFRRTAVDVFPAETNP